MKLVRHIYTIHLQIFHIVSAQWLCILQMAYNLYRGRGVEDEEQLPPPPPPPTPVELMQTVVEGQRPLAHAMCQLVNGMLGMVVRDRNQISIVISRTFSLAL
jgi:hypothetical protein